MTREHNREIASQLIEAATSDGEFNGRLTVEAIAAIINLCDPINGVTPTTDDIFFGHVIGTLDMAEDYGWCMSVHDYLDAAWETHLHYVSHGLRDRVVINDRWHWPITGMAYSDEADEAECDAGWDTGETISHCPCGHQCDENCRSPRYWHSMHGHPFMSVDDHPRARTCITCGSTYGFTVDEDGRGTFYSSGVEDTVEYCTGRTDMVHGIERICQADNGDQCQEDKDTGQCAHTVHGCTGMCCH